MITEQALSENVDGGGAVAVQSSLLVSRTRYTYCPICLDSAPICFRRLHTHVKNKHPILYQKLFCFFCNVSLKNRTREEYKQHKIQCMLANQVAAPIVDINSIRERKQRRKQRRMENIKRLNIEFNYLDYEIEQRKLAIDELDQTMCSLFTELTDVRTKIASVERILERVAELGEPVIKNLCTIVDDDSELDE